MRVFMCVWEGEHVNAHWKMLHIIVLASLPWINIGVVFQYFPGLKIPLEFHTVIHTYTYSYNLGMRCKDTEFGSDFALGLCITFTLT